MDDVIYRQQAIEAVSEECFELRGVFKRCEDAINALPPAQPERIKGKWTPHREKSREYIGATLIYVTYDYWSCDTCGYRVEDGQPLYNFCPHCGTDMRG